jgi:hypothetical protein
MNDDIVKGTAAVHNKEYVSQRVKQLLEVKQTV